MATDSEQGKNSSRGQSFSFTLMYICCCAVIKLANKAKLFFLYRRSVPGALERIEPLCIIVSLVFYTYVQNCACNPLLAYVISKEQKF